MATTHSTQSGGHDLTSTSNCEFEELAVVTFKQVYAGPNNESTMAVKQTYDAGYIMAGYTSSYGSGGDDFFLIKTNKYGDTLWTKTYGTLGDERANAIDQTADAGFIIAGYSDGAGAGLDDFYLIKTNANGEKTLESSMNHEVIWQKKR